MVGHTINGRVVLMLGTWIVRDQAGRVVGRVQAVDEAAARRRAERYHGVPADQLRAVAVLPTVYQRDAG